MQSCTACLASATQRSPTRRCSRTGSLSGALHAQQRWAAARWYASAICASGARDALPSGGTARAPGGAVTRVSRSILPGPRSPRTGASLPDRRSARRGPVTTAQCGARPAGWGRATRPVRPRRRAQANAPRTSAAARRIEPAFAQAIELGGGVGDAASRRSIATMARMSPTTSCGASPRRWPTRSAWSTRSPDTAGTSSPSSPREPPAGRSRSASPPR